VPSQNLNCTESLAWNVLDDRSAALVSVNGGRPLATRNWLMRQSTEASASLGFVAGVTWASA